MQEDSLLSNLTVRETLMYTLALRVPESAMNEQQRSERVTAVLADLNLLNVADSRVCARQRVESSRVDPMHPLLASEIDVDRRVAHTPT